MVLIKIVILGVDKHGYPFANSNLVDSINKFPTFTSFVIMMCITCFFLCVYLYRTQHDVDKIYFTKLYYDSVSHILQICPKCRSLFPV